MDDKDADRDGAGGGADAGGHGGGEAVGAGGRLVMDRPYAIDPMGLADMLGIPRDEADVLLEGANHDYLCRCESCRQMWAKIGPDPDTDEYGPFTPEEIACPGGADG